MKNGAQGLILVAHANDMPVPLSPTALPDQIVIGKEFCTVVGDGRSQKEVEARVKQIRNLVENTDQDYEREKLNERIARLSGGVAIIQVGAQTETELKEKKLRVEDALNATKAAVEEGIVIGGGCTLLKLAAKVCLLFPRLFIPPNCATPL